MYKKKFKYTDFFGNDREEECLFYLSQNELTKIELDRDGGLDRAVDKMAQRQNNKELYNLFEKIVLTSYGEVSDDGRRFIKSEELSNEFKQTPMYDILLNELCNKEGYANEFILGIMPKNIREQLEEDNKVSIVKQEGSNA